MCLNDGMCTRVNVARGSEPAIALTIATQAIADRCNWEVLSESTVGSDHYPIVVQIEMELVREHVVRGGRWILSEADWETFSDFSECGFLGVKNGPDLGIDSLCNAVTNTIIVPV